MAKAHVDPEQLRQFARDLKGFNTNLSELMSGLSSRMAQLEKSWRDQEQQKFARQLEQTMKALRRFVESSDEHVAFLNRKAGLIEDYLQQH